VPQYLKITNLIRQLIEFTDGVLEILPSVTSRHQALVLALFDALHDWKEQNGGIVHFVGMRLRISETKIRKPDLLFLRARDDPREQDPCWLGADLVAEVVSPADPERDTVVKRREYAEAGISEYWIVNPLDETITVLTLSGPAYVEHGVFRRGEQPTSVLLPGFGVGVAEVFDAD
jgi:Uma2 family endonuclease